MRNLNRYRKIHFYYKKAGENYNLRKEAGPLSWLWNARKKTDGLSNTKALPSNAGDEIDKLIDMVPDGANFKIANADELEHAPEVLKNKNGAYMMSANPTDKGVVCNTDALPGLSKKIKSETNSLPSNIKQNLEFVSGIKKTKKNLVLDMLPSIRKNTIEKVRALDGQGFIFMWRRQMSSSFQKQDAISIAKVTENAFNNIEKMKSFLVALPDISPETQIIRELDKVAKNILDEYKGNKITFNTELEMSNALMKIDEAKKIVREEFGFAKRQKLNSLLLRKDDKMIKEIDDINFKSGKTPSVLSGIDGKLELNRLTKGEDYNLIVNKFKNKEYLPSEIKVIDDGGRLTVYYSKQGLPINNISCTNLLKLMEISDIMVSNASGNNKVDSLTFLGAAFDNKC